MGFSGGRSRSPAATGPGRDWKPADASKPVYRKPLYIAKSVEIQPQAPTCWPALWLVLACGILGCDGALPFGRPACETAACPMEHSYNWSCHQACWKTSPALSRREHGKVEHTVSCKHTKVPHACGQGQTGVCTFFLGPPAPGPLSFFLFTGRLAAGKGLAGDAGHLCLTSLSALNSTCLTGHVVDATQQKSQHSV